MYAEPSTRTSSITLFAATALLASLSYADAPPGHYTATTDVVTDSKTGLAWQRVIGTDLHTFADALTYCDGLTLGGQSDWRVPTLTELQTLVDESLQDPASDPTFPDTPNDYVWTSSVYVPDNSQAWVVRFSDGYTWYYVLSDVHSVRCVR